MDTSNFLLKIVHECKDLFYLEEMIKEHSSLSERDVKQLRYFAKVKLKGIEEVAKTLKDYTNEEALPSIVSFWFEWRSEWIRYNAVNNFNMIEYGKVCAKSVIQSTYVSYLIDKIEPLIPEEKLEKIQKIMVEVQYEI